MFEINETYTDEYADEDIEVWECDRCGRTYSIRAGGDIACCICEFEDEPRDWEDQRCLI